MRGTWDPQIDRRAVSGLTGTPDSLAYRTNEIERHHHGRERWYGKLAVQTATDWADNVINSPFQAISGNNDYGSDPNDEAQVVGTADTPVIAGRVYYDPHRILIVDCSVTTPTKIRAVYGTGTLAAAVAAGQFSTKMLHIDPAAASNAAVPVVLMTPRLRCGIDKLWLQFWSLTDNATIDFYIGWHEYEG